MINIVQTKLSMNQVRRWDALSKNGPPPWDYRNIAIGKKIPNGSWILDLGSGPQSLKKHIQKDCKYQPCDIIKNTIDVIGCDFNKGEFPDSIEKYDYIVCSGILEYIRDYENFLLKLMSERCNIIITYNLYSSGKSKIDRMKNHWVNHIEFEYFIKIFQDNKYNYNIIERYENNEIVFHLEKNN